MAEEYGSGEPDPYPRSEVFPEGLVPKDCPWPIVLGIDPGTRVLGYGAIVVATDGPRLVACGVIRPAARATIAARLARLQTELEELLRHLRPSVVAVESAFSSRNAKSALRLGEARGIVLAAAARAGLAVAEVAPAAAKKAVIGHGNGSKEQVARMVATILKAKPFGLARDATDALAVALAHVKQRSAAELSRRAAAPPAARPCRAAPRSFQ